MGAQTALSRMMRRACLIVAGVLFVVILAMTVFLRVYDTTPKAEIALTEALGKPVLIKGGVSMAMIGLMPALEARDVYFDGWAAKGIEVTVPVWRKRAGARTPLSVDVSSLSFRKKELGDLTLDVAFEGGKTVISPKSSSFLGGGLAGEISFDGQKLKADISLDDADARALFPDYDGKIDAVATLSAVGRDSDALLRTLNGTADVLGGKGRLMSAGVNFWTADLLPVLMGGKKDEATLNCLIGRFNVRNGVASDRNILIDTDRVTVRGRGGIDFRQQKIHFLLTPSSKGASLASLATPIRISGSFEKPDIYPDPTGAAVKLGSMLLGAANPAIAAATLAYKASGDGDVCAVALQEEGQAKP